MYERKFYRRAISVAWPAVLEFFFVSIADMIDTFMVSSMGPSAVAAIGLTTQPKFMAISIFLSINAALSALIARRRGEDDRYKANQTLVTAVLITLFFVIITDLLFIPLAPALMEFAGSNPDTHDLSVNYFRIIMWGVVFLAISTAINGAHRGAGNTQIAFVTNIVSTMVNMTLNWLLIGGNLGFPALGIQGAAIATVSGTLVSTIMCILSLRRKSSYLNFYHMFRNGVKFTKEIAKEIMPLGLNIFVEGISMRVGFFITAITAAGLGTNVFASHQIGMNLLSLTFSFGNGMQVAAVALTGNAIGANRKEDAKKYGKVCQQIGFAISLTCAIVFIFNGRNIFKMFFDNEEILAYSDIIIRFLVFIILFQISQVIYAGCLRAGGDVRYTLFVALLSVTVIRSAVTLFAVHILGMGLAGIWLGILSDQMSRFFTLRYRFNQYKWLDMRI